MRKSKFGKRIAGRPDRRRVGLICHDGMPAEPAWVLAGRFNRQFGLRRDDLRAGSLGGCLGGRSVRVLCGHRFQGPNSTTRKATALMTATAAAMSNGRPISFGVSSSLHLVASRKKAVRQTQVPAASRGGRPHNSGGACRHQCPHNSSSTPLTPFSSSSPNRECQPARSSKKRKPRSGEAGLSNGEARGDDLRFTSVRRCNRPFGSTPHRANNGRRRPSTQTGGRGHRYRGTIAIAECLS